MTQLNRSRGTDVDGALIDFIYISAANDMRDDGEDNFVLAMLGVGLAEQILENRNLSQSRNAAERFGLLVFQNSAHKVHFTIFEPNLMLYLALPDHGLANSADILLAGNGRNIHRNLERNLPSCVYVGRNVHVAAHIKLFPLTAHYRLNAHATAA